MALFIIVGEKLIDMTGCEVQKDSGNTQVYRGSTFLVEESGYDLFDKLTTLADNYVAP